MYKKISREEACTFEGLDVLYHSARYTNGDVVLWIWGHGEGSDPMSRYFDEHTFYILVEDDTDAP